MKEKIIENCKTLFYALIIALFIRSFFFQPFYIPSSSMEPNLLIGDRLFVSKYSYGYSRHSLPFSPKIYNKRIFKKMPERGDVIVFKTPADNRTDYIKRLIGLPGDTVQIINQDLYINDIKIKKEKIDKTINVNCGNENLDASFFEETLPNGKKYIAAYRKEGAMRNSDKFIVPKDSFFFMGDNRDCSKDSRFLSSVGYVCFNNLVGKARLIFFSNNKMLSDCCEAIIGAIYIDRGIDIVRNYILKIWKKKIEASNVTILDPKTKLQEYSLKAYKKLPLYRLVSSSGPRHNPIYKIAVSIIGSKHFIGVGNSKQQAELDGASKLLIDKNI